VIVTAMLVVAAPAVAKQRSFQSPSGNVGCLYSSSGGPGPFIRCDVLSLNDAGFFLYRHHKAKRHKITDTVAMPGAPKLAYGHKRSFGRYTCKSYRSGLKCVNRRNHHGFKLSRASQKLF
jgi:hypothetical protein